MKFLVISMFLILFLSACIDKNTSENKKNVLQNKVICIDPGHGGTAGVDSFRVGKNGEREEWINLRVSLILAKKLEQEGAKVLLTRTKDVQVPLIERAKLAKNNNADVFISVHHNGVPNDTIVNFPTVYFHAYASKNQASVQLAKILGKYLNEYLFNNKAPLAIVSDHMIYPDGGTTVLRNTYGIPAVIGEASYFTNPEEEQKLKDSTYNEKEADAYVKALQDFFNVKHLPVYAKDILNPIEKLPVDTFNQKSEDLFNWLGNYHKALKLYRQKKFDAAADLFWKSALFFPDSYVAGECHYYLSKIYAEKNPELAEKEKRRYEEFYVKP